MDLLLLAAAAAVLLSLGAGSAALLLGRRAQVSWAELAALAWCSAALAMGLLWCLASLTGVGAIGLVAVVGVGVAAIGGWQWRRQRPMLVDGALGLTLLGSVAVVAVWLAATTRMEWDGVFVWEIKVRAIEAAGGLPLDHLRDPSRVWSHHRYPLLVPFLRAWFGSWLGRGDEVVSNVVGSLFLVAIAGFLLGLASRLGRVTAVGSLVVACCTPLLVLGPGSAVSGYADLPLAAFYLGAVSYLLRALGGPGENAAPAPRGWDLAAAGWLAAGLVWTKDEGLVLWVAVMVLALLLRRGAGWQGWLCLAGPGLAVAIGWRLVLASAGVDREPTFHPVSLELLIDRLPMLTTILPIELGLALRPADWGALWLLFPLAAAIVLRAERSRRTLLLVGAVLLPLPAYSGLYLFSAWSPVAPHIESSFSRLLIPLALPAALLVARAVVVFAPVRLAGVFARWEQRTAGDSRL